MENQPRQQREVMGQRGQTGRQTPSSTVQWPPELTVQGEGKMRSYPKDLSGLLEHIRQAGST